MLTWTNKAFQFVTLDNAQLAHMVDGRGVILFRWRMYYDDDIYEDFDIEYPLIKHFETFKALCRQFDTPGDAEAWYNNRIKRNGRK